MGMITHLNLGCYCTKVHGTFFRQIWEISR